MNTQNYRGSFGSHGFLQFAEPVFGRLILLAFLLIAGNAFSSNNVVLITIDTLRADAIGPGTPNINALAAAGMRFTNVVSPAPYTLPSHASILTGLLPPAHGLRDNSGFYLQTNITTIAELFRAHGFRTAAFIGAFPLDSRFGLDKGFDVYDDSYPIAAQNAELAMPERKGEIVIDLATQWLAGPTDRPFFVWIHLYDPHFPYSSDGQTYEGEVAYCDRQVGRLIAFLKQRGLGQNTTIILTSDHGESLGEHQEKTHGVFAYESTMRVPLIISPFKPRSIDSRVRLIDIAPTILQMEGIPAPKEMQGVSLLALHDNRDAYFESLTMHYSAHWAPLQGFYSGNFKFIRLPEPELYDLKSDASETNNLCRDQQLCRKWAEKFNAFESQVGEKSAPVAYDDQTIEELRALGYVAASNPARKKIFTAGDDPKHLIFLYNRVQAALSLYKNGNSSRAVELLESIVQERPGYGEAYLHAAYILDASGNTAGAIEMLRGAITNGASSAEIEGRLGLYLLQTGKQEEALNRLEHALKREARNIDNWNYLGMTYAALKKPDEAAKAFQKVLQIDSGNAMALENLGALALSQKSVDSAIQNYLAALKQNPHLPNAYNGLGVAYAQKAEWAEAIRSWQLALQENPRLFDAKLNLGFAYLKLEDKESALRYLKEFEQDAPPSRYAKDLSKVRSVIAELVP